MRKKLALGTIAATTALLATGLQSFAATAQSVPTAQALASSHAQALSFGRAQAAGLAGSLGLGAQEQLKIKDVVVDKDGTRHLRYDRTYAGLPVLGGDLVVHETKTGATSSVTRATTAKLALKTVRPAVSATDAKAQAHTTAQALLKKGVATDEALAAVGKADKPQLVVWAATGTPRLAYLTVVEGVQADGTPSKLNVVTDARSGQVIQRYEGIETGTGNGVRVGNVALTTTKGTSTYSLKDAGRGGIYTTDLNNSSTSSSGTTFTDADDAWGNGSTSSRQSAGVDAQFGAAATWDYYKNTFGRSGIKGNGVGSLSRTHYGSGYVNAFWDDSCFCMTYGDGSGNASPLTSLDVSGHEISHGVTSATAGLTYSGESGGLNEANSDIFGTMVEFYENLAADTPDYLIGEKININGDGSPLRYMDKPSKDGGSADYWSSSVKNLDVHYSSGVGNHFFYLLSEGSGAKTINGVSYNSPTYSGTTVTGIGRDKAAAIWYRALTVYFTSSTNYKAARVATLKAAADLYGSSSTQYAAVAAAWTGVNVS
ncbi:M4 family metallopeptidase [Actinacidiphila oryziradicis]|uniref:M4 family metallopeptidase n=1 Tax=Actinacidiphila oryziradicis TaxID=2571141 RepID=UPI0023F18AF7|nr:M4 family metallopeptidase [Actinacidiphila oryziradicis]MCW2873013.1 family peptidase [Actinacidiphila oryziradicis]